MKKQDAESLKKSLLKLRHENRESFLRLIAAMVEELESLDFLEIAATYSSWPINVPVRKAPKKSLTISSTNAATRDRSDTREGKCAAVLDRTLRVGSALTIKLRGRKPPDLDLETTSLAVDLLNWMNGVRNGPKRLRMIRRIAGVGVGRIPADEWGLWVKRVQLLKPPTISNREEWMDEAIALEKLRFGSLYVT